MIHWKILIQDTYEGTAEWAKIEKIAQKFHDYLSSPKIQDSLSAINTPNTKSQKVEEIITPFAEETGFSSQKKVYLKNTKLVNLPQITICKLKKQVLLLR
ncbi:MAG: hypothetical protein DK304_001305 [Chloroflexi bacterium]|jgi:hypothetical protein|nr:MAG: hypothetical protein DK304_001305 [Chloroflexota bacterium]